VLLGSALAATGARGQATYSYTGQNFDEVMGTYTVADRLTGWFTVAAPLVPGTPYPADISGLVTSFSFADGVQTLSDANAEILAFSIGTDGGGNLTEWSFRIWKAPIPTSTGVLIDGIHSASFGVPGPSWLVQDVGFQQGLCLNIDEDSGLCDGVDLPTPFFGELFSNDQADAGTWISTIFSDGFESGNVSQWSSSSP
jgi:hypothetical protein